MKSTKSDGNVIPWQTNLHVIGKKICKRRYQNSKIKVFSWRKYQVYENPVNLVIKISCFFFLFFFTKFHSEIIAQNFELSQLTAPIDSENWFLTVDWNRFFLLSNDRNLFGRGPLLWNSSYQKNGNSKCPVTPVYKKFFVIYIKFNKSYDFVEKYFFKQN